jgi:tetratricopeptide (TPR) repeat protein
MSSFNKVDFEKEYRARITNADQAEVEKIISELLESAEVAEDDVIPIRIGIDLRDNGQSARAAILFSACLAYSSRASALYELGVIKSLQGEVDEAVLYLDTRLKESGLEPYEKVFFARQYARQGRLARAKALLEEAAALNPKLRQECLITYQAAKFINQFDKRVTLGLLEEVKSIFRVYVNANEVEDRINEALSSEAPFLLLRMGDGEGAAIRLSIEDEAEYNLLYRDNLEEFAELWFRDRSIAFDPNFSQIIADFNKVPFEADVIGTFQVAGIENEYNLGSRRGITYAVNTLRILLKIAKVSPELSTSMMVGHPLIHYFLLTSGALGRLLQNRSRVGLISCHSGLASALKEQYGIKEMEFIKIPGEQANAHLLGEDAAEGVHWPDRYLEVLSIIASKNRKGCLFLVAAGILGKIYAKELKKSGAVVLDIGAVADALAGKNTRIFPKSVMDLMPA